MSSDSFKNCYLQIIRLQIIYIWYTCINGIWHSIIYKGWYAVKQNKPTNFLYKMPNLLKKSGLKSFPILEIRVPEAEVLLVA